MKSQKPLSRKDNIVVQEMKDEVLVYDLGENKAFCLNETSAVVWEACDGNRSISEISEFVSKKLNSPANEELVWLALDQLKKEKLLSNSQEVEIDFKGLSRRETIKKVGLATLLALPVVIGVTSPVAAASSSNCLNVLNSLCQCNDAIECAPGGSGVPTVMDGCAPITGGTNCSQDGAACVCVGPFVCVGVTGLAAGRCGSL